jgi:hypothetical protein
MRVRCNIAIGVFCSAPEGAIRDALLFCVALADCAVPAPNLLHLLGSRLLARFDRPPMSAPTAAIAAKADIADYEHTP